jgi:phage minor structural protein
MIPRLFRSDATQFNSLGLGALSKTVSCQVTESINGEYYLEATVLNDDKHINDVQIGNIIAVKPNATDGYQAFVIESVTKTIDNLVNIYATHIAQYRAKLIPVSPFTANTLADALAAIKNNSLETNPFTLSTNKTVSSKMAVSVPYSMRELMGGVEGSLIDTYRGEYHFDNYNIELLTRRGADNGIRILYGQNMTDFELAESFSWLDSVTGVLPYWRNEDVVVIGDIQYSSLVGNFKYHKTITLDCGEHFEEQPTKAQLNAYALTWINSKGMPSLTLNVEFNQYGLTSNQINGIRLGDTVQVINTKYNVKYESRIVTTVYDVLADKYSTLTVGSTNTNLNDAIGGMISSSSVSAEAFDKLDSEKVNKSGDTMSGQLKTSYRNSVAMGSYGTAQTTVDGLVNEVRFSSGAMGSASINTAYTKNGVTIPGGWYNFIFSPHRSGGVNGQASGDNCNYGTLILTPMTFAGDSFIIRCSTSGAANVRRIGFSNRATFDGNASGVTDFWNANITTHQNAELIREGNIVYCYLRFSAPSTVTSGQQICVIPTGYRPNHVCHFSGVRAWAVAATAPISVSMSNGGVNFINNAYAASANYIVCVTWITDDAFPA